MKEYDENEQVKETFAHFGRAYYMANVFETGLALAILQTDFLGEIKKKSLLPGWKPPTRKEFEAEFEKFLNHQHAQTLGNLIKRAQKILPPDEEFQKIILDAKNIRDLLAHHYFRERSMEFVSRKGRDNMIEELKMAHGIFAKTDELLDKITEPQRNFLGFSEEMLQAEMAKFMKEASALDDDYA